MENCECCRDEACALVDKREKSFWSREHFPLLGSCIVFLSCIIADHVASVPFVEPWRLIAYLAAYVLVAYPVFVEACQTLRKLDFFTEYTLMIVATVGAFLLGEYPEAVAVMLFYSIGELFQDIAVDKAKRNIKNLLDVRPQHARVYRDGHYLETAPDAVRVGETVMVKVGEKVPLDGELLEAGSRFNTSALTGESVPRTLQAGDTVLAGMLNTEAVVTLRVTREYKDSSLAHILALVQDATAKKAKTELFIRRFARIYTPIVFLLALSIVVLPWLVCSEYVFDQWLYRSLVFLVVSCPCALVISVPLGYFSGIGAASRQGILFKGANYLDLMTTVNTVIMDKTGTLTKGTFSVQQVCPYHGGSSESLLGLMAALEQNSTHPIAKAITAHAEKQQIVCSEPAHVEELSGYGLSGIIDGHRVLVGNDKLMRKFGIVCDPEALEVVDTVVMAAVDDAFVGYVTIADEPKSDARETISRLKDNDISDIVMLSGDRNTITQKLARELGISEAYGDLLPEEKVAHIQRYKDDPTRKVAFVGDGINDAPSLAMSDVGIAMGGMGSDAAIDIADVIIQTDQPSKIVTAIRLAKSTHRIVWQNIIFAITVKVIVLLLGALGEATMWEAVIADVGVSLLAILNAIRILRMKFDD